jgi:uncharacterized protein (TIGR02594 family)
MSDAPWLHRALDELVRGVVEIEGPDHNDRILEYHAATTLGATDDETSWCSSFVAWCFLKEGLVGTSSALSRSWMDWGTPCEPRPGAVCVLWRIAPSSHQGHVAFYLGGQGEQLYLLGGNQGNRVSVQAFPFSRLLGFRWPHSPPELDAA